MTLVPNSINNLPAIFVSQKPTTAPNVWHGFYRTVRLTACIQVACLGFAAGLSSSASRKRLSPNEQRRWFALISSSPSSLAKFDGTFVNNLMMMQKAEIEAQTELNIGLANLASLGLQHVQQQSANAEQQLVELIELVNVISKQNASAQRGFAHR